MTVIFFAGCLIGCCYCVFFNCRHLFLSFSNVLLYSFLFGFYLSSFYLSSFSSFLLYGFLFGFYLSSFGFSSFFCLCRFLFGYCIFLFQRFRGGSFRFGPGGLSLYLFYFLFCFFGFFLHFLRSSLRIGLSQSKCCNQS
ncbi:hypothetical protein D3C78_255270 [compost metagenome]